MPEKPLPPPLKPADPVKSGRERDRGWGIAIMNQLALPGFGTVMAGRKVGYFQLCLSVTGAICLAGFIGFSIPHIGEFLQKASRAADDPEPFYVVFEKWKPWFLTALIGITSLVTAWLWALGTSVKAVQGEKKSRNVKPIVPV